MCTRGETVSVFILNGTVRYGTGVHDAPIHSSVVAEQINNNIDVQRSCVKPNQ